MQYAVVCEIGNIMSYFDGFKIRNSADKSVCRPVTQELYLTDILDMESVEMKLPRSGNVSAEIGDRRSEMDK